MPSLDVSVIEDETVRPATRCVVREVDSGDWGIAGNALGRARAA